MCRVFILHNHITLYVFVAVYIVLGIYWGEGPEIIDQLSVYTDHSVNDKINAGKVSGIFILINISKVEKCAQSESSND